MIQSVIKICLFGLSIIISFYFILLLENGNSDFYYTKLTGERQASLIIGNSKAAQGIVPDILNSNFNFKDEIRFFNYAFTSIISPYGESYLSSIKAKIDYTKKNNFIVCVDVWSLIEEKEKPNQFIETKGFLSNVKNVNVTPNFEYLLNYYDKQFYEIILRRFDPSYFKLHKSGWLEIDISIDSISQRKRLDERVMFLRNQMKYFEFSEKRYNSLIETLKFLKENGDVFLVKIPSKKEVSYFENLMAPNLDEKFIDLSIKYSLPYFNVDSLSSKFIYTDGLHLYKDSSKEFSQILSIWLKSKIN